MPTNADPMLASSVSGSPFDPCLDDFVGHVFLASYIPSDSYNLSAFCKRFPDLLGKGHDGVLNFRLSLSLSLHNVWLWASAPAPSVVRGSLPDDDWISY